MGRPDSFDGAIIIGASSRRPRSRVSIKAALIIPIRERCCSGDRRRYRSIEIHEAIGAKIRQCPRRRRTHRLPGAADLHMLHTRAPGATDFDEWRDGLPDAADLLVLSHQVYWYQTSPSFPPEGADVETVTTPVSGPPSWMPPARTVPSDPFILIVVSVLLVASIAMSPLDGGVMDAGGDQITDPSGRHCHFTTPLE